MNHLRDLSVRTDKISNVFASTNVSIFTTATTKTLTLILKI